MSRGKRENSDQNKKILGLYIGNYKSHLTNDIVLN